LSKSPFLVKIFFMLEQNPVGNFIFCITYFTALLCCSVNNHGSDLILIWSPSLFKYSMLLQVPLSHFYCDMLTSLGYYVYVIYESGYYFITVNNLLR